MFQLLASLGHQRSRGDHTPILRNVKFETLITYMYGHGFPLLLTMKISVVP